MINGSGICIESDIPPTNRIVSILSIRHFVKCSRHAIQKYNTLPHFAYPNTIINSRGIPIWRWSKLNQIRIHPDFSRPVEFQTKTKAKRHQPMKKKKNT